MIDSLADYRWLVSSAALKELDLLAGEAITPSLVRALRHDWSVGRAQLLLQQVELRKRAQGKFSLAHQMLFTEQGLQQSTEERIAVYKASCFPPSAELWDLCCGIGGDLIGMNRCNSPITALDSKEIVSLLAGHNAKIYEVNARVKTNAIAACFEKLHEDHYWHADPDRRPRGRRTVQPEWFSPSAETFQELLDRGIQGCMKLAPASPLPQHWESLAGREWIGSGRECKQQVLWFGSEPLRLATILPGEGAAESISGSGEETVEIATEIGRYLYEPHAAVLAAGLDGKLASKLNLLQLSPGVAYFTGDLIHKAETLSAWEVEEVLPFDRRRLRQLLRTKNIGRLEVKKRNAQIDPRQVQKELAGKGDESATLLLAGMGRGVTAILGRRVSQTPPPAN